MRPAAAALVAGLAFPALSAPPSAAPRLASALAPLSEAAPGLEELYLDLHRTPELSLQETVTAGKLAARLRALGFEVTEKVGGNGVVGVLKNGDGPVVMLRTDLDALPVEEKTGLPYASRALGKDDHGQPIPVMHACGHDLHMTAWTGAATLLARAKGSWRGTLVLVGQPAEEKGAGAETMLKDGLFTRFPRPSFAVALHVTPDLPAGQVGVTPGPAFASVDSVDVTIHGKGGHGAMPHRTIDPILIGARTVVTLQALVSREKSPFEPAVVSVGSFQAGAKHNVIPPEARLKITVRAYREEVRQALLDGIRRVAAAEAMAAGAPGAAGGDDRRVDARRRERRAADRAPSRRLLRGARQRERHRLPAGERQRGLLLLRPRGSPRVDVLARRGTARRPRRGEGGREGAPAAPLGRVLLPTTPRRSAPA